MRGHLLDDCEGIRGEGGAVIIRKANDHLVYIRTFAFDVVWVMMERLIYAVHLLKHCIHFVEQEHLP